MTMSMRDPKVGDVIGGPYVGDPTPEIAGPTTVQEAARHWETARKHEREARKRLSQAIREAREAGASLADLAAVLGVSRQHVEQLSK